MKRVLICLFLSFCALAASAQPAADALSKCLAESTTGKDRKDLARWLFVAMGAHPDLKAIATLPATAPEESSRVAGQLLTRLLAESCPAQAKAAAAAGGAAAFHAAFSLLGQLAMQELMSDKDVTAGMGLLQKHMDLVKLQSVLGPK
jgi:hypothetical protein